MSKIKLAVIGTAHPHTPTLFKAFDSRKDDIEVLGCADVPPFEGVHGYVGEDGVTGQMKGNFKPYETMKVYRDWKELAELKPDVAVIGADNRAHAELAEYLLSRGITLIFEKPMAADFADGVKMYRAYKRYGVPMLVNWPVTWFPAFRLARELTLEGAVGRPLRFIYRSPATLGPFSYGGEHTNDFLASSWWYKKERGGGSVMDYACYGCMLSTWYYGRQAKEASAVTASFGTAFSDVPDFSAVTLSFGGALAQLEGSWSTLNNAGIPTGPIVYGDAGVLVADRYSDEVKFYSGLRAKEPTKVYKAEPIKDCLGDNIFAMLDGREIHETLTPEFNLAALAALDASARSAEAKATVSVDDCRDIINK